MQSGARGLVGIARAADGILVGAARIPRIPAALAVAAVIAQYSPILNPGERKVIAGLFDGNTKMSYPIKTLSVSADTVMCRISNVAIAERSCEIAFKKGKRSLKGRAANEVFATLASAGVTAEGAAGSMIENVSKLSCTLDLGKIKQKMARQP